MEYTIKSNNISLLVGYSLKVVDLAMRKLYGNYFSRTHTSRFESVTLSFPNMRRLKPLLQKWLEDANSMPNNPNS